MKTLKTMSIVQSPAKALYALLAVTMFTTAAHGDGADADPTTAANAAPPASQVTNSNPAWSWDAPDQAWPADAPKPKEKKDPLIIKVMALGIGLAGTVLGIGIGILSVCTEYKKRRALITFCHQERMAALEKGLDLPPFPRELIHDVTGRDDSPKPIVPGAGLKAGLMWLAIGIGSAIYLSLQQRAGIHPSIGAIPIGIGIVYLICYTIERRRKEAQTRQ